MHSKGHATAQVKVQLQADANSYEGTRDGAGEGQSQAVVKTQEGMPVGAGEGTVTGKWM